MALISGLRIRLCCKLLHESEMWIRSGMAVVYRLAAAAPIRPLAWKLPYAPGAALKRKRKKKMVAFINVLLPAVIKSGRIYH